MLSLFAWVSQLDFSARGRARVIALTALGTICCIAVAFAIDSYSLETNTWRWGSQPINNVIIPLVLAPPFFFFLLSKLRQLAEAHHELLVISATDGLTSLYNRRAFTALVDMSLGKAQQQGPGLRGALLLIDVDHFKLVNDSYGHEQGDEALKLVAGSIKKTVRDGDIVGRVGGEEFCVFMPSGSPETAVRVAERIRKAVQTVEFAPKGKMHALSISLGGVLIEDVASFSDLYRRADQQLYQAKHAGRNRVEMEFGASRGDNVVFVFH